MKKIIIGLLIMLMLCSTSLVLAQNQLQETRTLRIKAEVKGLENAILRVKNEQAQNRLSEVLERITEKRKEILNKLENLEIEEDETGKITATGEKQARFLNIFRVRIKAQYTINDDNTITRQKRTFDNFFVEIN